MMKLHFQALTVLLPALALWGCKGEATFPAEQTNNPLQSATDLAVHAAVENHLTELNSVGLAIGILRNDSVWVYGYGEARLGTGTIPDGNTFFEIGSITKVFTAIGTTQWLEEKGLPIDTEIAAYLPSDIPRLAKGGVGVTFEHLMTHRSGLTTMPDNIGPNFYLNIDKGWARYDSVRLYRSLRGFNLRSTPGTTSLYSNMGVGTLGVILERNTRQSYAGFIENRVCLPLGLTQTKVTLSAQENERMAYGYVGTKEIPLWTDLGAMNAAGALRSTPLDLLEFARRNLDPPASPLGEAMRRCQQSQWTGEDANGNRVEMGLGWFFDDFGVPGHMAWWHNGGTGGFDSNLFVFQEKKAALVVLFNSLPDKDDEALARLKLIQALKTEALK